MGIHYWNVFLTCERWYYTAIIEPSCKQIMYSSFMHCGLFIVSWQSSPLFKWSTCIKKKLYQQKKIKFITMLKLHVQHVPVNAGLCVQIPQIYHNSNYSFFIQFIYVCTEHLVFIYIHVVCWDKAELFNVNNSFSWANRLVWTTVTIQLTSSFFFFFSFFGGEQLVAISGAQIFTSW